MDDQYINDLYSELGGEESFGTYEDFVALITTDDSYINDFHSAFGESTLGSLEDFKNLVKKKVVSEEPSTELPPTSLVEEEEAMVSESPTPDGESVVTETELPVQAELGVDEVSSETPEAGMFDAVTPELVGMDEEEAVVKLTELYGEDFEFQEANRIGEAVFGDSVLIKSKHTGRKEIFNLDAWTGGGEMEDAAEIKAFMQENIRGRKDVESDIEAKYKEVANVIDYWEGEAANLQSERKAIDALRGTLPPEEINPRIEAWNKDRERINKESQAAINSAVKDVPALQKELQDKPLAVRFFEGDEKLGGIFSQYGLTYEDVGTVLDGIDGLTETVGWLPNVGVFTDEMFHAVGKTGWAQNRAAAAGNKGILEGENLTPETIQLNIEKSKILAETPPTRTMVDFQNDFRESREDGDNFVWSFLTAAAQNKAGAAQSVATSWMAMGNEYSLAAGATAIATGIAAGATIGAAGGTAAGPIGTFFGGIAGGIAGGIEAIPYAMGLMGVAMETGLSFSDGMNSEFSDMNLQRKKEGLPEIIMTKESLGVMMEDPEIRNRIRNKAIARGVTIGVVDALFNFIGVRAGKFILNRTGKTVLAAAGVVPIETIGEGGGEALAQLVTEGEISEEDVAAEMLGQGKSVASLAPAYLNRGVYKVNGENVSRKKAMKFLETATPDEVFFAEVEIANDPSASEVLTKKQKAKKFRDNLPENLSDSEKDNIVKLEEEREEISKKSIFSRNKTKRVSEIQETIQEIAEGRDKIDKAVRDTEDNEEVKIEYSDKSNVPEFLSDYVSVDPETNKSTITITGKELRTKQAEQDAIQKQSTETVDAQESTTDGSPMGGGDVQQGGTPEQTAPEESQDESTDTKETEEEVQSIEATDEVVQGLDDTGAVEDGVKIGVARQMARKGYGSLNDNQKKVYEAFKTDIKELVAQEEESIRTEKILKGATNQANSKQKKDKIKLQAKKVKRALSKVLPNLNIVFHETPDSYYNAVGTTKSAGEFVSSNVEGEDGSIHIDLTRASFITTVHEAFHAAITKGSKNEIEVAKITLRMVKALKNETNLSDKILTQLADFEKRYEAHYKQLVEEGKVDESEVEGLIAEEWMAELAGILSQDGVYENISVKNKTLIKKWINRVARLFGLEIKVLQDADTDVEVVAFFNNLVGALTKGEVMDDLSPSSVLEKKGRVVMPLADLSSSITSTLKAMQKNMDKKTGVGTDKLKELKDLATKAKVSVEDFILGVADGVYDASEGVKNTVNKVIEAAKKIEEPKISKDLRTAVSESINNISQDSRTLIESAAEKAKVAVEDFVVGVADGVYEASSRVVDIAKKVVKAAKKVEVKEPVISRAARRKAGRAINKLMDNKKFVDAIVTELNKLSAKDLKAFIDKQLKQIPSIDPELVAAAKQAGITVADLIEQSIRGAIDESIKLSKQALAALDKIKKQVILTAAIIMMASSPTNNLPSEIAPQSFIETAKESHPRVRDVIETLEIGDFEAILLTIENFATDVLQEKGLIASPQIDDIEIKKKTDKSKQEKAAKKVAKEKAEVAKKAKAAEKAKAVAEAKKAKAEADRLERESHYVTDEGDEITIGGGKNTSLGMVVDLSKGNVVVEIVPVAKAKAEDVVDVEKAAGIAGTTRYNFELFSEASKKYKNKEFPVQIVLLQDNDSTLTGVLTTKKTEDVKPTDLVIPFMHSAGSMQNNIVAVSDLNLTPTKGGFIVNDATNATEGTLIPAKITSEGVFPFHLGLTSGGKTAKPTARKNIGFNTNTSKDYRKARGGMVIIMSSDGKTSLMVSGSSAAIFSKLANLQTQFPNKNFYMYRGDTGSFSQSYVKKNLPPSIDPAKKNNLTPKQIKEINLKDKETLTVADLKKASLEGADTKGVMIAVKKDTLRSRSQLVAPNGKPSNLNAEQHEIVRTPAFKKWFGDWENDPENASKVVDENGEPLVVYHGTAATFDVFEGHSFFTDDWYNADGYAGGENIYEVFLNTKNPLVVDAKGKKWDELDEPYGSTQGVVGELDTKKYDGVVFNDIKDSWIDDADYQDAGVVYSIPVSNQIKLADGSNRTFDATKLSSRSQLIAPTGHQAANGLVRANEMEKSGSDPLTIRQATGLERGVDGKWRYEIEDATIDPIILGAVFKQIFTEDDGDIILDGKASVSLSQLLDDPELFKYYPELKNLEIEFDVAATGIKGQYRQNEFGKYNPQLDKIVLNPRSFSEGMYEVDFIDVMKLNTGALDYIVKLNSTLRHEIQHGIQLKEGFAFGGDPDIFLKLDLNTLKSHEIVISLKDKLGKPDGTVKGTIISLLNEKGANLWKKAGLQSKINLDFLSKGINNPNFERDQSISYGDFLAQMDLLTKEFETNPSLKSNESSFVDAINQLKGMVYINYILGYDFNNRKDLWHDRATLIKAEGLYDRLAGEAEARVVQHRLSMSKEQRRNTTIAKSMKNDMVDPVAQEDQLIFDLKSWPKPVSEKQLRTEIKIARLWAGLSSRSQLAIADVTGQEDVKSGNTATTVRSWDDKEKKIIKLDEPTLTVDELFEGFTLGSPLLNIAKRFSQGFKIYSKKVDEVSTTIKLPLPWSNPALNKRIKKLLKEKELLALKDGKWKKHKGYPALTKGKLEAANKAALKAVTQEIITDVKSMMVTNIKELFYSLNPEFVEISKNWYEGANRIAQTAAKKYGVSLEQSSAILAVLSPQNDWFNNISGAERVMTVMANNRDLRVTTDRANEFVSMLSKKKPKPTAVIEEVTKIFEIHGNTSINEMIEYGKKNNLDMTEAIGFVIRVIDQTLYDPTVYEVSPEGMMDIPAKSPIGWNSPSEIANAVSIFLDGSVDNVAQKLGGGNKVRNFYNNIVDPNSPNEYLTADTHAASVALLQPMSANDAGGVGLFGGGNSAMYALVKDAYIEAANDVGLLPRQLQSVTWEAIRTGMNDKSRTAAKKASVFKLINELKGKELSHEERAREIILDNPSTTPAWAERRGIVAQKEVSRLREIYKATTDTGAGNIFTRGRGQEQLRAGDSILDREASDKGSDGITSRSRLADIAGDGYSIYDMINKARGLGFTDASIQIALGRQINPATGKLFTRAEVKIAMAVPVSTDQNLPSAFGNLEGGMVQGQEMFNNVMKRLKRSVSRTLSPSNAKMRAKAHEFLSEDPIFLAQSEQVQAEIRIAFDKTLGTTANQQITAEINALRQALKQRNIGAATLRAAQKTLRLLLKNNTTRSITSSAFVKAVLQGRIKPSSTKLTAVVNKVAAGKGSATANIKNLSAEDKAILDAEVKKYNTIQKKYNLQWTQKEVNELTKQINDLTVETLAIVGEDILSKIVEKKSNTLLNLIEALLDPKKMEQLIGGRVKGKGVDIATKDSLMFIRDKVAGKKSIEETEAAIEDMRKDFLELMNAPKTLSEAERTEMENLDISIRLLEAKLDDLTNNSTLESLERITTDIEALIFGGRNALKDELRIAHEKYVREASEVLSDILDEPVDLSDNETKESITRTLSLLAKGMTNKPVNNKFGRRIHQKMIEMLSSFDRLIKGFKGGIATTEALQGLVDSISIKYGEMFGGRLQELITDRINRASYAYKRGKMDMEDLVSRKAKDIFGKKWQKILKKNGVKSVYVDMGKGQLKYSQNELYYYYNLAKDPANLPSFEKMWGKENVERILKDIEDALTPEVKQWADWQVNELYPSLYNRYNPVYRSIYRNNMPWNEFYAGRIFREGENTDTEILGMDSLNYRQSVAGQSTKARVNSSKEIQMVSGDDALLTYLEDMERFRAYGETFRDVSKIIDNETIKAAIEATQGKKVYKMLKEAMNRISTNGFDNNALRFKLLDGFLRRFVRAKIGINPMILMKQLTSTFTYANDIGVGNWLYYSAKNIPQMRSIWKEIFKNSPYLEHRYREDLMNQIDAFEQNKFSSNIYSAGISNTLIKLSMAPTKLGDKWAIALGGQANYSYYKAQFNKAQKQAEEDGLSNFTLRGLTFSTSKATEQDAIEYAIERFQADTKSTQQSTDTQDRDYYQKNDPLWRAFNVFLTTPKQYWRKSIMAYRSLFRKAKATAKGQPIFGKKRAGKGSVTDNIRTLLTYRIFMPVLYQWASQLFTLNPDEDEWEEIKMAALLGNLNSVVILGQIAITLRETYLEKPWAANNKSLPIIEAVGQLSYLVSRYRQSTSEEKQHELAIKIFNAVAELNGIPATQIYRFQNNWSAILEDGADTDLLLMRLMNASQWSIDKAMKKAAANDGSLDEIPEGDFDALPEGDFDAMIEN